jgi:hypothetical protein
MGAIRALLCGSRDWDKPVPIDVIVGGLARVYGPEKVTIIEGQARGADLMAAGAAMRHGVDHEPFPADWKGHGKAAGPIRNRLMLTEGKPDVVFAFKDDFDWTLERGGTENMVRIAKEAGVPVYVVSRA